MSSGYQSPVLKKCASRQFLYAAILAAGFATVSYGDLVDTFKKEYPAAAAKLEEAYSNVRIVGKTTTYYDLGGQQVVSEGEGEVLRSGGYVRSVSTTVASTDPRWAAGTVSRSGGNAALSFSCHKAPTDKEFTFDSFGPEPNFESLVKLEYRETFAAFCIADTRVIDLISEGRIVSAVGITRDGNPAVEVTVEYIIGTRQKQERYTFDPRTWALLAWTQPLSRIITSEGSMKYEAKSGDGPPRLVHMEAWQKNSAKPTLRNGGETDVTKFEFVVTPVEQFKPAALAQFGVTDIPEESRADTGVPGSTIAPDEMKSVAAIPLAQRIPLWIYCVVVGTFVALGFVFYRKSRQSGTPR